VRHIELKALLRRGSKLGRLDAEPPDGRSRDTARERPGGLARHSRCYLKLDDGELFADEAPAPPCGPAGSAVAVPPARREPASASDPQHQDEQAAAGKAHDGAVRKSFGSRSCGADAILAR
jgi:hypothetical protein